MPRRPARRALAVGLAAFLLGLLFARVTPVAPVLVLGGAAILAWTVVPLLAPWRGERLRYRVRYHAPAGQPINGPALAEGLARLARYGAVALIWRREEGELTLTIEIPASMSEALAGLLPRLLPELQLEPAPGPALQTAGAKGFYLWPLPPTGRPNRAGTFAALLDESLLIGDLEVRLHLVARGAACLVWGTPGPTARAAGLRSIWRPLRRFASVRPHRPPAARRGKPARLLHRRSSPLPSWLVRAFRRYPMWDLWPGGVPSAIELPATGGPGTARLDTKTSLVVPLPAGYVFPDPMERALLLGESTADGRPVGLPITLATGGAHPAWGRHFLALGQAAAGRGATVEAMIRQAISAGVGLVHLDPIGGEGRRLAGQIPAAARPRVKWADIENPAGSLRINLLAVPPLGVFGSREAAEASALSAAVEDHVPLLGAYLSLLGLTAGSESGREMLLDWARVLLLTHHRERLVGAALPAPPPDLRTLYELIKEPGTLPTLAAAERDAWDTPCPALAGALERAGAAGEAAVALARATLAELESRQGPEGRADRHLLAAGLRDRLSPALDHPALSRLWRGPFDSPANLLNRVPAPIILSRLPTVNVATAEAVAARWYGLYIFVAAVAAAKDRLRVGSTRPPLLLVVAETNAWHATGLLRDHLDALGRAGIAVLSTTASLPPGPAGDRLLAGAGTWWLHTLESGDVERLRAALRRLNVTADLPLAQLPSGVAVVKSISPTGAVVATAYTDAERLQQLRSANVVGVAS